MSLFELARKQLVERKKKFTALDVFDRAVKIRHSLDEKDTLKHRQECKKHYLKRKSENF